jgi:hypothetical protein
VDSSPWFLHTYGQTVYWIERNRYWRDRANHKLYRNESVHTDAHANRESNINADRHSDCHRNDDSNFDANLYTDDDPNCQSNSDRNDDSNCHTHGYAHCDCGGAISCFLHAG